jgi:hypothetical protein
MKENQKLPEEVENRLLREQIRRQRIFICVLVLVCLFLMLHYNGYLETVWRCTEEVCVKVRESFVHG